VRNERSRLVRLVLLFNATITLKYYGSKNDICKSERPSADKSH